MSTPLSTRTPALRSPRLRALAQRPARAVPQAAPEHCELCGEPIPAEHRHLLLLQTRELQCSCRACALLFDRRGAGAGRYRLVPERRLALDAFELSDLAWEGLRIPVEMAFFFHDSSTGSVACFYPGPMGATESRLELEAWEEIERANPILSAMEPDVEALLVNRARGMRRQWLVPIDDCFAVVGLIRTRWRGLSGGKEVWVEIEGFFQELERRSRSTTRQTPATAAARPTAAAPPTVAAPPTAVGRRSQAMQPAERS